MTRFNTRVNISLRWRRLAFDRQVERARRNCQKVATHITKSIKKKINVFWNGIPSQPGQPPKKRTGTLVNSIETRTISRGKHEAIWKLSTVYYGKFLEEGTIKMKERPFIEVTLLEEKHTMLNILREP